MMILERVPGSGALSIYLIEREEPQTIEKNNERSGVTYNRSKTTTERSKVILKRSEINSSDRNR